MTGLILFDIVFTVLCIKYLGAIELNPLCHNFNQFIFLKIIVSIGALLVMYWKREDKFMKISILVVILLYGGIGIFNLWQTVNYLYYKGF